MVAEPLTAHAFVAPSEGNACEECAYEAGAAVHNDGVPVLPESPDVPEDVKANPDAESASTVTELRAQMEAMRAELTAMRGEVVTPGQIPFDLDLSAEASLERQLANATSGKFPWDDLPTPGRFVHVTVGASGDRRLLVYNVYETVAEAQQKRGAYWGGKSQGWYVIYKWLSDMGLAPLSA